MVTLHYNNTSLQVQEDDSSFRHKVLMGENSVTLKFSLSTAIDFPVGTYIEFQGETYTLTSPEKWNRHGEKNIEYTLVLDGIESSLKKYKLRDMVDGRVKFSLNATPAEFLQLIIDNLNLRENDEGEGLWGGECLVEAERKTIEFNHSFLSDALNLIANTFETEYEIAGDMTITLGKIEHNKSNPVALSYGKGNGFKPNTGRANTNDSRPVEVLYVQGGERNIDRSTYGSRELHLPAGQEYTLDGKTYEVSEDGLSIHRSDRELTSGNEDSYDGSEIYPKRVGTISSVVVVDAEKHFYDFIDLTIPNNLDYNDYLITGETMSVIFQTGMLAGKEFEISSYDHATRKFEIVPQDIDGITMPDATWKPVTGDTYAIFGCTLPAAYICDNDTQTGAEWDLFKEAVKYLAENEEYKFTFSGELQGKWARENWLQIGGRLVLGGYINFSDTQFAPNGTLIRIVGIKQSLSDPYAPTIEISNSVTVAGAVSSSLKKIAQQEVQIEDSLGRSISFTKRRFRDAKDTMEALAEAMLDNFTSGVTPISVQTMQLLVGDESLQFRFVDDKTTPVQVEHIEAYDSDEKIFISEEGIIQHLTLGISSITGVGTRAASDFKYWTLAEYESPYLGDALADKRFYVYAKCSRTAETAEIVLSQTAIKLDGVAGYYHLLMGILNKEIEGTRSYAPMYGFTEILPSRITADRIVSGDGNSFLDLVGGKTRIGGASGGPYLEWNINNDGKLRIHGSLNVDGGGSESPAIVIRGAYSASASYYWGDIVTYQGSTYICIYEYGEVKNILPTNTTYWTQYVSKGEAGVNGTLTKYQWAKTLTNTAPVESQWKNTFAEVADHSGYYLWQRHLKSTDGGTTWSVAEGTTGIILDPTITKEEAEAIEALNEEARRITAEKLGYASWDAFQESVAFNDVLIQNGQINAALINAELIIAKVLETSPNGKRVVINHNEVNIFDEQDNTVVRMHGEYHPSIEEFKATSGTQTSVQFCYPQFTQSKNLAKGIRLNPNDMAEVFIMSGEDEESVESVYTGRSFSIINTGISRVTGNLRLTFDASFFGDTLSCEYTGGSARVYLSTSPSSVVNPINLGTIFSNGNIGYFHKQTSLPFDINLAQGTYYIWVNYEAYCEVSNQESFVVDDEIQCTVSLSGVQVANATVALVSEKLEVFANGVGYRQTSNSYGVILRTGSSRSSEGYLQAEISANQVGLRVGQSDDTEYYAELRYKGLTFSLIPRVYARWTYVNGAYSLREWMVKGYFGPNTPYTTQTDYGVNFNLPSDFNGFTFNNDLRYEAHALQASENNAAVASVYVYSSTQLRIDVWNMSGTVQRTAVWLIVW